MRTPVVWLSPCIEEAELARYRHLLPGDEIAESARLRQSGDRGRFLTARILLRLLLSRAAADTVHPSFWRFLLGPFGKPEVSPGLPSIGFNLSHAGNVVAVAADIAGAIGVDVEELDSAAAWEVPATVLSKWERLALARCRPETIGCEFVKLWTLKEAYAKRAGLGVHLDFSSIDIDWQPESGAATYTSGQGAIETRTLLIGTRRYQVSVALHEAADTGAVWQRVALGEMARPWLIAGHGSHAGSPAA